MKRLSLLAKTWAINAVNSVVFVWTRGERVLHEGRYAGGVWRDWAKAFSCRPANYFRPCTEEKICSLVKEAKKLRAVGAGHSFNGATLTNDTLISLDRYKTISFHDHPSKPTWKVARVQAGLRLRDFTRILWNAGYSVSIAGSTDAQSIAGLISTDVHGTGRDHGFVSESILSLRIVDANGNARTFRRGDDVFHSAIGGAGTCGVIIEAEMECEPRYNLAKAVKIVDRNFAESNIERLLDENTHLSFYYFAGFARTLEQENQDGFRNIRMNKWNRTIDPPDVPRRLQKIFAELVDMLFAGFLFDFALSGWFAAFLRSAFHWTSMFNRIETVWPSTEGFPRKLYYRHDEMEYGIPIEQYCDCLAEVRKLLVILRFPLIIEVRFTPDKSQALLGPGTGRRTAYLEITPSMSHPTDEKLAKVEQVLLKYGGRPHLGKKTFITREQLIQMYPPHVLQRFKNARRSQDPDGKFLNGFTVALFR